MKNNLSKLSLIRRTFFCLLGGVLLLLSAGCVSLTSGALTPDETSSFRLLQGEWEKVGMVSTSSRGWNWLFKQDPVLSRGTMERETEKEARRVFGETAEIRIEYMEGRWHPLSLLMFLDLLGFVEETTLYVSVWIPASPVPESPPVEKEEPTLPEKEKIIVYSVHPLDNYILGSEFTRVEYRSAEMLQASLDRTFEEGEINRDEWEEQTGELPPGGRIGISLGRTELDNAISKWFSFTLMEGNDRIFRKKGVEDIPYVPGSDKLWWNDISFDIKTEWVSPLTFTIYDEYQSSEYEFQILREEYDAP